MRHEKIIIFSRKEWKRQSYYAQIGYLTRCLNIRTRFNLEFIKFTSFVYLDMKFVAHRIRIFWFFFWYTVNFFYYYINLNFIGKLHNLSQRLMRPNLVSFKTMRIFEISFFILFLTATKTMMHLSKFWWFHCFWSEICGAM